ncbi:MAG: ammonia channel protein, partial [Methylomonas sp.]|nr:ammonia channel protein [Methylomonas sp.]
AAGALTWMAIEWLRFGKPSVLGIVTGMVAGLGTITPASGYVGPIGGLVIGLVAGFVCFYATQFIKRGLKIDDSLDVFPVHGVGGCIGSILTGVFAAECFGGLGLDGVGMGQQVGVQALAVLVTVVWSGLFSYLLLKLIDVFIGLRVTEDEEVEGLDIVLHEETGYHNL